MRMMVPSLSVTVCAVKSTDWTTPSNSPTPSSSGFSCLSCVAPSLRRSSRLTPSTLRNPSGGGVGLVTRLAAAMLSLMTEWLFPSSSFRSAARKVPSSGPCGVARGCRDAVSVGLCPAAMSAWTSATKSASVRALWAASSPRSPCRIIVVPFAAIWRPPTSRVNVAVSAADVTAVTRLRTCSGRVISLDSSSSTRRATSVPGITRTSTRVGPVCSKLWASGSETVREN